MKIHYFKSQIIAMLIGVLMSGCTVGPNYHAPKVTIPPQYIIAKGHPSENKMPSDWWNSLPDPVLVSLINQALQCNLDIQQAEAKIRQARAALNIASADFLPQLDLNGKISRDHLSANSELISAIPIPIPLTYTDTNVGFDASWELDFFGHTRRTVEASRANLQSDIENTNDIALSVAAEVARDYIQYRVYQQRTIIAKHTIASYWKTARLVRLQKQAGYATSVDLQRIVSQAQSAEAALPPLYAQERVILSALAVMVGEPPESLYKIIKQFAVIPVINSKGFSIGLPSDLLQRRPDIRMADRELAVATAYIGVATANQFPRFQLVGDIGSDTVFRGTFANAASRYWSYGAQVYLPIFEGGRLKNAVKESEAERDSILANYRKSVLQALADVESALIRFDKERVRQKRLLSAYKEIKASVGLINLQYVDGKTSLIDVLDVERQANDLYDQYVQSVGQVAINTVSLYKALGGGVSCQ
jgi:NodT family efflux transporter outer membrane factor (OMF) lipoprotein